MKKRNFLTSVAVLAAAMALDAGAALPQLVTEQSMVNVSSTIISAERPAAPIPFVLERPVLTGASQAKHSYHSSHRSHSSHSSHHSSRY